MDVGRHSGSSGVQGRPKTVNKKVKESQEGKHMNLSSEMLDYVRFLGVQVGRYPEHYNPTDHSRALVYSALENYRIKHISPERVEEFYTIAMAAFQDGEEEGARLHQQALELVEANRVKAQS